MSDRDAVYVPPGGGYAVWLAGDVYTLKLPGAATGGAFTLLEAVVPPGGGPPPHVHYREDETFVVLEGELALRVGEREFAAPVGTVLHVPRGMRHSFSTIGSTPARMVFHYAPAGMDGMFAEIGVPARPDEMPPPPGPEDVAKLLSVAEKYGFEIFPPGT